MRLKPLTSLCLPHAPQGAWKRQTESLCVTAQSCSDARPVGDSMRWSVARMYIYPRKRSALTGKNGSEEIHCHFLLSLSVLLLYLFIHFQPARLKT